MKKGTSYQKVFRKKSTFFIILFGAFAFLIVGMLYWKRFQSKPPELSHNNNPNMSLVTENQIIPGQDCSSNTYTDNQVGFSIDCPDQMKVYIYTNRFDPYLKKQEKIIFLCESQISSDPTQPYYKCPSGGIMIWANGDGWGGGCDPQNRSNLLVNNENESYCLDSNGFRQLYAGDPTYQKDSFLIEGSFSSTFTQVDALNVLKSFKVL